MLFSHQSTSTSWNISSSFSVISLSHLNSDHVTPYDVERFVVFQPKGAVTDHLQAYFCIKTFKVRQLMNNSVYSNSYID